MKNEKHNKGKNFISKALMLVIAIAAMLMMSVSVSASEARPTTWDELKSAFAAGGDTV